MLEPIAATIAVAPITAIRGPQLALASCGWGRRLWGLWARLLWAGLLRRARLLRRPLSPRLLLPVLRARLALFGRGNLCHRPVPLNAIAMNSRVRFSESRSRSTVQSTPTGGGLVVIRSDASKRPDNENP